MRVDMVVIQHFVQLRNVLWNKTIIWNGHEIWNLCGNFVLFCFVCIPFSWIESESERVSARVSGERERERVGSEQFTEKKNSLCHAHLVLLRIKD